MYREVNHILYHNRSQKLIGNFLPKFDLEKILKNEDILTHCRSMFNSLEENTEVIFGHNELNLNYKDVIFEKKDIEYYTNDFLSLKIDNTIEYDYLIKRGVSDKVIEKYNLLPLTQLNGTKLLM